MADTIRGKIENAGDTAKDAAKKAGKKVKEGGQKVAEKAGQAADWMKEKAGIGHKPMSAADMTAIKPHMEVISSCGCRVGTVDHMEGGAIKLTQKDSPDGQHHFIPTGWVARVD